MRITYIAAGAGGMHCGACNRDVALLHGLLHRGHDVQVIPLYTPLTTDDPRPLPTTPVFYGGINVYLSQRYPRLACLPALLRRWLDHPVLLRWISRRAIATEPRSLGPMTISVLEGRYGRQKQELDQLLRHLEGAGRPDVISLTNSLFSGLASDMRERLGCPVVCSVQGEDGFVNAFPEPLRSEARTIMRRNARHIDAFVAPSQDHAAAMTEFLAVPPGKMHVVPVGLDAEPYRHDGPRQRHPFTVGTLSAIVPRKGLDILIGAIGMLVNLRQREVYLRIAGQALDQGYQKEMQRRIEGAGLQHRTEWMRELDFTGKIEFLRSLSVFAVPSRVPESRALAALEALACGVPLVATNIGAFPEMITATQAGVLVPPEDAEALAQALETLLDDPVQADEMGRNGPPAIARHHSVEGMVQGVEAVYREVTG